MKVNQWTLGLAAVGLVTLPAALMAEEKLSPLLTAVTPTSISGAVSTSVQWAPGTGNGFGSPRLYQAGKADGFNLDVVSLTLDKPLDEAQWASGYHVDLWLGPDANTFATVSGGEPADLAIKQAYVALRAPLGNGLDLKVGVFDSIIGYESHDSYKDPNYSRSYATSLEPHTHTGVLASYQISSLVSASAGVANTTGPAINRRADPPHAESFKTYMGSVALTAPDGWGFVSGSTLYMGAVSGWSDAQATIANYYVGLTLNTPVKGWRLGGSFDYVDSTDNVVSTPATPGDSGSLADRSFNAWALTLYSSYQLGEKTSVHLRGEYVRTDANFFGTGKHQENGQSALLGVTATLQYDLWKNVISRLELIWDHQAGDNGMRAFGGTDPDGDGGRVRNRYTVAVNLIYRF